MLRPSEAWSQHPRSAVGAWSLTHNLRLCAGSAHVGRGQNWYQNVPRSYQLDELTELKEQESEQSAKTKQEQEKQVKKTRKQEREKRVKKMIFRM